MSDIQGKWNEFYSLEQLAGKDTCIHRLHPLSKMLVTAVYLVALAVQGRYDLASLVPFLFYPAVVMALAEIPPKMILKRLLVALPFCLFAGVSNLFFDRAVVMYIGVFSVTGGVLSLLVILFRTGLCVSAVLILVSVTPFVSLTRQWERMYIPVFFVRLLEMIYRYLGVLMEEAATMVVAYRLRNPGVKIPQLKDFGSFVGQLFLRSMERAERIYQAMRCRGYGNSWKKPPKQRMRVSDFVFLFLCGMFVFLFW